MANSIKMLLDVTMPLSVKLGQTNMTVRELLSMKKGRVVELHRMAGESVDILISNKLMAKGEITVADDKLAVRVNQLYGKSEKFKHL